MPPVFGFHALSKKAETYRHPFTGVAIATPVFDSLMHQDDGVVTDRSSYGNNGTCAGCVGARGVFAEGQKFDGVNDTIDCGSDASLNITGAITLVAWVNQDVLHAGDVVFGKMSAAGGLAGYALRLNTVLEFWADLTGVWRLGATTIPAKRATHVAAAAADAVVRLYVDGLQDGRGTWAGQGDNAAELLMISGYSALVTNPYNGSIELPQIYAGALSPEQIYRKYLEAKDVPIYLDDFSSYAVTPVAKAVGSMCGPYRVVQGTLLVTDISSRRWVQCTGAGNIDGSMPWPENNAYGTYEWTARKANAGGNLSVSPIASSDRIAWLTAGQNTYSVYIDANEAVYFYRVAGAAPTLLFQTANSYVSINTDYDFRLVRRVGGQCALYIRGGTFLDWTLVNASAAGTNPVTDNTYTAAPYMLLTGSTESRISGMRFSRVCERPASFPWEFLSGTYAGVVSGSTVWMRCLTAGVTYLPKDLDWQTMIFGVRRGAAPNVLDTLFLASEIGSTVAAGQNGYCLRMAADGSVQLIRTTGGIEAAPTVQTAAGYTAITTEYEFKINRVDATNAYQFFIRGGAYADWTLMFAATLGIHTSSNYTNWDLDGGDRISAPAFYHDVR